ncbi:hypothetical protein RCL_jg1134.t1 [Rhizophagus clarus]|uniref:Uncharacterized protein n=1 Tax=Rhizophagus clarus TaxID=94130 RepID=A0A8H3KZC1_9GLOM|nr:hypothetical protein RCL_jg1134.t1 [Rhizophagus clarus]
MNIYALFTFRIRGIVDQGMFIIKEESKNDQRSNWKLLYYQSISVMNICALFHIHDRGIRGVLKNHYNTNHILL